MDHIIFLFLHPGVSYLITEFLKFKIFRFIKTNDFNKNERNLPKAGFDRSTDLCMWQVFEWPDRQLS